MKVACEGATKHVRRGTERRRCRCTAEFGQQSASEARARAPSRGYMLRRAKPLATHDPLTLSPGGCAFATRGAALADRLYQEWRRPTANLSDLVHQPTADELQRWQTNFSDADVSAVCNSEDCTLVQALHVGPYSRVPQVNACDLISFGGSDLQRKLACATPALFSDSCVVVSVGSENVWDFEEAIFARTRCRVHVFDCTIVNATNHPHSVSANWGVPLALRSRVTLHRLCIGAPQYKTWGSKLGSERSISWPDLLQLIGLGTEPPALLKIDVRRETRITACTAPTTDGSANRLIPMLRPRRSARAASSISSGSSSTGGRMRFYQSRLPLSCTRPCGSRTGSANGDARL